jgi:hypothetical protein
LYQYFPGDCSNDTEFSGVDSGNLAMYPGEQSITWRILPCPDLVNTLPT